MNNKNNLSSISSKKFEENKYTEVIIPVGSFEQHGPHGALGTDFLIAQRIAELISKKTNIPCLPPIAYGCSKIHMSKAGTISIEKDIFYGYLKNIIESLYKSKVKKIYIINGHGGNITTIRKIKETFENLVDVVHISWWIEGKELDFFSAEEGHHAGSEEMSVLMTISESLVDKKEFIDTEIKEYDPYLVNDINELTETGSIGVVSTASKDRGEKYLNILIDKIIEKYDL